MRREVPLLVVIVCVFGFVHGVWFLGGLTPAGHDTVSGGAHGRDPFTFDRIEADLGSVPCNGEPVAVAFNFINTQSRKIRVEAVRACCGLSAECASDWVEPGQSGRITLSLDPGSRLGAMRRFAMVHMSCCLQSPIKLQVKAKIVEPIKIRPPRLVYGSCDRHAASTQMLRLTNCTRTTICIKESFGQRGLLQVHSDAVVVPPLGEVQLSVRTTSNLDEGPFEETIVISTDSPQVPELRVPASGWAYEGPVFPLPRQLCFGFLRRGERRSRTVLLRSSDGNGFEVVSAKCMGMRVDVAHSSDIQQEHEVAVTLGLPMGIPAAIKTTCGEKKGALVLQVRHRHGLGRISIPLSAYVATE